MEIWDGAFVIANRYSIDSLHWIEWDKGACGSRFGTLNIKFHPDRVQQRDCKIGIVNIAGHTSRALPEDNVWDKIARWIRAEALMLVTGNCGKDNDTEIADTAVAACFCVWITGSE